MNDPVVLVLVAILPSLVVFLTAFYSIRHFLGARTAERNAEHLAGMRIDASQAGAAAPAPGL